MATQLQSPLDITIYRGFQGSGYYTWSPFVIKLEARLRIAGLSYRTEGGSLSKAPKGKLPYVAISSKIDTGSQAPIILADSTLITQRLVEDDVVDDLNASLSPTEKALDSAIRALIEDKLCFYQDYEYWNENYYAMRSGIFAPLSYPLQVVIGLLVHRRVMRTLYGQGTARFSTEEISSFRKQIWENLNALLVASRAKQAEPDAMFWVLGGDGPSEADATLFGFITSAMVIDAAPETKQVVKSFPAVVDYARRIHNRYFPDYTSWE